MEVAVTSVQPTQLGGGSLSRQTASKPLLHTRVQIVVSAPELIFSLKLFLKSKYKQGLVFYQLLDNQTDK
jgi:hypothetical protein